MATPNRAAILAKTHKILKKYYQPVKPAERSVLETVLYACCLQNAAYDKADEAFAKLQEMFFDWNEVRVTTATELAEVLGMLPNPRATAAQLKRCLQGVFETHYSFDLETLHKQNQGKAVKLLEEKYGLSAFGVGYVTQNVLGGHAIPLDEGAMQVMFAVGAASEAEAAKFQVPGLERAVAKSKGVEFGSLLHQLGADLIASPFGNARKVVLEIDADAKERLPKRKAAASEQSAPPAKAEKPEAKSAKESAKGAKEAKGAKSAKEAKSSKDGKKPVDKKEKKPASKQSVVAAAKKPASKGLAKKKPR